MYALVPARNMFGANPPNSSLPVTAISLSSCTMQNADAALPFSLLPNSGLDRAAPYGLGEKWILNHVRHREVLEEICSWPGYRPTPLRHLPNLAAQLGIGSLWYKDESGRFDLGSFKALGGAYGVLRVIQGEVQRLTGRTGITGREILDGAYRDLASAITVTCATDGNHGRSVAWGAGSSMFGCRCVVYLPSAVSPRREAAISAYGAEIVRTSAEYDEAVRQAQRDARRLGRFVVSDTSYPAYVNIPRDVMQGYTVMVAEILQQLPDNDLPTHVFLQGGVGGLAASFVAHLWEARGSDRPIAVVVEPDCADCLFQSAAAGRPTIVSDVHGTIMAGLACGEVSLLAWHILERGADAFMAVADQAAKRAMRMLAAQQPAIVAGESGAAGLAGLLSVADHADSRQTIRLDQSSRVLLVGTEGATDPELYEAILTAEQ
jgi:diaminopropionate ammonia-lyase